MNLLPLLVRIKLRLASQKLCEERGFKHTGMPEHGAWFASIALGESLKLDAGAGVGQTRAVAVQQAVEDFRARRRTRRKTLGELSEYERAVGRTHRGGQHGLLGRKATEDELRAMMNLPGRVEPVPMSAEERLISMLDTELHRAHMRYEEAMKQNRLLQERLESAWDDLAEARLAISKQGGAGG